VSEGRAWRGPRLVAVALIALGGLVLVESTRIGGGTGFTPVGPAVMPLVVGGGLLVLGVLLLARTTIWPDVDLRERVEAEDRFTDWPTTGLLVGLLVAYAIVLNVLGYIVATAAFVPAGARILGSRDVRRDVILGVALALVVYIGFTRFLGVRLPAGLLAPILP
jgi:putative tricarboxylic transport membrane protein